MFLSMAAMALTTYALLVLHSPLPTLSTPLAVEVCSEEARAQVWSSLPECRPRPTLIKLPLPRDPSILQVIHFLLEIHIPDYPWLSSSVQTLGCKNSWQQRCLFMSVKVEN